jgi:hypothetical protein
LVKTDWQYDDIVTEVDLNQMGTEINANTAKVADNFDSKPWTPITLNNGVQIVQGGDVPAILHPEFSGRTLVNLLGREGNCESAFITARWESIVALDSTKKTLGMNSLNIKSNNMSTATISFFSSEPTYNLVAGKSYLAISYIHGNSTSSIVGNVGFQQRFSFCANSIVWADVQPNEYYEMIPTEVLMSDKFSQFGFTFTPALTAKYSTGFYILGTGQNYWVDGIRLYEITSLEKTYIDSLSAVDKQEYIAANYPYVDDMKHVNNVYLENKGKNLLPSLQGASIIASGTIILEPYKMDISAVAHYAGITYNVNVAPSQTYTFSLEISGIIDHNNKAYYAIEGFDSNGVTTGVLVNALLPPNGLNISTFTTGANTSLVKINILKLGIGTFIVSNFMLNIGNVALPFEPQKPSYMYLPDLQLKSSADGSVRDELYTDGYGKPRVTRRFREMVLDGSLGWGFYADRVGFKNVIWMAPNATGSNDRIIKYDGKVIQNEDPTAATDRYDILSDTTLILSITDTDSGWGETYQPTLDDIKAYFWGWEMGTWDGLFTKGYNGTGTQAWRPIGDTHPTARGVVTLPTQELTEAEKVISTFKNPYRLMYQLTTSIDESVEYEGSLMLHEGANQVEVGTGIVVREAAKVGYSSAENSYHINFNSVVGNAIHSPLSKRVNKILNVYRNGRNDSWLHFSNLTYGNDRIAIAGINYDPTAAYSVTYLALDTYALGIAPQTINVKYAPNIRESVDSLVREVVEARTEINVLRNTKDDKNKKQPEWISATLLNGWTGELKYRKNSIGQLEIAAYLVGGVIGALTNIARLPDGYRPLRTSTMRVNETTAGSMVNGEIYVNTDGIVAVANGSTLETGASYQCNIVANI